MNPPTKIPKSFCTTREAGRMLGVSVRTVQLWTEGGLLKAWKTEGGHRRIERRSVERLLADRPAPAVAAPRFTILVVDDELPVLRLYERRLARWPMNPQVVTAQNGTEALVRLGLLRPDLLVTDLKMPGMDGFRMLQQLREMPELAGMTTVVVSGLDSQEIEDRGGVPEGIPVLAKPIDFTRLLDIATVVADRKRRAPPESGSAA
jgi:excisionase family DNA binding protein